jgi:gluconolactonase
MPNGINFSPDESRIYIADTGGNQKNPNPEFHKTPAGIHCYEVSKEGQFGKKLFKIDHGSDGMCLDVKGNLYTTSGKILVHNPEGKLIETIEVPEGPANCTFGGEDMKTLFITARTSLYAVRMKNAGAKPVGAKW